MWDECPIKRPTFTKIVEYWNDAEAKADSFYSKAISFFDNKKLKVHPQVHVI